MLYCFGSGHELLSASAVFAVCQDSKVFLVLLLAVSIIFAPVKSIVWSKAHACLATLEFIAHCFVFLICSFFLVLSVVQGSSRLLFFQSLPCRGLQQRDWQGCPWHSRGFVYIWCHYIIILLYINKVVVRKHKVTSKPIRTLQQHFPVPKFRPSEEDRCNVIYKIPCASCPWSYIGETKRSFSTRKKRTYQKYKTVCYKL